LEEKEGPYTGTKAAEFALTLKIEYPSRWGSSQAMIHRVLAQQKAIALVLSND